MDFAKLKNRLNAAQDMVKPRTAILWGRADLLGEAIESILSSAEKWQVIKMLGNPDARALTREVERLRPEILIINQRHCTDGFPAPLNIMESFPELIIITINPDNNLVEIFNKQKIRIKEVSDLLSVIDMCSNPAPKGGENNPGKPPA